MKNILLLLVIFFPFFANSQESWQTVNHEGISVKIPSGWGNKNTIQKYENDIAEYQISAWEKGNSASALVIQWVDFEIDEELYIESAIETQTGRFPVYRKINFDNIKDVDFLGLKAKGCHFYGKLTDDVYIEGEYIAFTQKNRSYLIILSGDRRFYKSAKYNNILNSIKPIFSSKNPSQSIVKNEDENDGFIRYEFKRYSLSIPNTMELRNENSLLSLSKEIMKDKMRNVKKIDVDEYNFVFQPKGADDITNIEKQKKALSLYSRVLIKYEKGKINDFMRWNDDISTTQTEYNELNKIFKNNLWSQNATFKQMGVELISVRDIEIKKNKNKFVYIKQQYERKGLNGNVIVIDYYINNNDEGVKMTISYRVSESNLWKNDLEKIIETFNFTTKR